MDNTWSIKSFLTLVEKWAEICFVPRGTICLLCFLLFFSCRSTQQDPRPNIIWIVAEDLSPVIPSYGDSTIQTPFLSKLAAEGVCFDKCFSPSGVCAPSRAAITTGIYPITMGANHMRTGPWFPGVTPEISNAYAKRAMPPGIVPYEVVLPSETKMMTEYLRAEGYYCTNNAKEDYQFMKSVVAWDESSQQAHWRNRPAGQPFFSVFNIEVTHESQIWQKENDSLWIENDAEVVIPPYLPDTDRAKKDIRRMYSNIAEMDHQVGTILAQLEEDGLLDHTYIFWFSDHGGPLPRQKRLLYDSGIRVPMIIRHPDGLGAGTRNDELVSFVDLAPTVLSIAGIRPSSSMQGRAYLGKYAVEEPKYIYAASDRFDESREDPIRAIRDRRYKYIRYYDTLEPMYYPVGYRDQMPIMQELHLLHDKGELNAAQALWFRSQKPKEELFDTYTDMYEVHDLSVDMAYDTVKQRLSKALDDWLSTTQDLNMMPESALRTYFWPGGQQPVTSAPQIERKGNKIEISTTTVGASIGYKLATDTTETWQIYTAPIQSNERLKVIAHRVGYKPSSIIEVY